MWLSLKGIELTPEAGSPVPGEGSCDTTTGPDGSKGLL